MRKPSNVCPVMNFRPLYRLVALVAVLASAGWLWGCGSGGGQAGQGATAGSGGAGSSVVGTGVVSVGGGTGTVSGTVTLASTSSRSMTRAANAVVSLYRGTGTTAVARAMPGTDGSYGFSQLPAGSYNVVVSGSGLRPQWDRVGLAAGRSMVLNYKMSAVDANPSDQELQGLTAQASWLMRGFYGFRFSPVTVSRMLKSNRSRSLARSARMTRTVADLDQANVQTLAAVGGQYVCVDRGSIVWVSANDTHGGAGTSTGVYKFSNNGTNQGLLGTSLATNSGGGPVASSHAADVLVTNEYDGSCSLGLLPRGATPPTVAALLGTPPVGSLSVWSLCAQNQLPSPRFVASVINDTGGEHPELWFIKADGTFAKAAVSTSLPATFRGRGVVCDSADQSIYVVGDVSAGGTSRQAHFLHVSADGSTLLEDVTLGSFAINGWQNLSRDAAGVFYTSCGSLDGALMGNVKLVRISGSAGNRTVTTTALVNQSNTAFQAGAEVDGDVVTVDSAGMIWALDCNANQVTRYDANVQNAQTVTTGTHPMSIATDSLNNAWIVCSVFNSPAATVLNKVVVGGVVAAPGAVTTVTQTDGSQVTTVPGTTTSPTVVSQSYTPTLPQSQYGNYLSFGSTTTSGTVATVQGTTDTYSGPVMATVTGSYDSSSNQYSLATVASNQVDQAQTTTSMVFSPNGSGTVNGQMDDGSQFSATYEYARAGDGTVTLTAQVTNPHANQTLVISALFNADGSVSNFQVTNDATGLKTIGRLTTGGKFNAQVFRLSDLGTAVATASNDEVNQSLVDSLMRFLTAPANATDPETVWQMFAPSSPTSATNTAAPGYREVIVIYYDSFGLHQVVTYVPIASVGNGSGFSGDPYSSSTGSVPSDGSSNNYSTLPPGTQGGGAFSSGGDANALAAGICGTGGAGPHFRRWRMLSSWCGMFRR